MNMFSLKLKSLLIKKSCPDKYFDKETISFSCIKNADLLEFPGSPVVRTRSFHCLWPGLEPWLGELKCCKLCGMAKKKTYLWNGISHGKRVWAEWRKE